MVFPEATNQNQNFKPAPQGRQALFLRLKRWFAFSTPKKKIFLVLGLILVLLAMSLIIYFVFGQSPIFRVYFDPDSGDVNAGSTNTVHLMLDNSSSSTLGVSNMRIEFQYTGVPTGSIACTIDPLYVNDLSCSVDAIAGVIRITKTDPLGPEIIAAGGSGHYSIASLNFTPPASSIGNTLAFKFVASVTSLVDLNYTTYNSGVSFALDNATYNIVSSPQNTDGVYLMPVTGTVNLGGETQIEVRAKTNTQDIVAVGAQIKYDPQYLNVEISDAPSFPVAADSSETHNRSTGQLTLVRGTYGDGDINNGTITPQTDTRGLRGDTIIAYLTVTGVNLTSPTTAINVAGSQFVLDDGQGTITNASGIGGTYTVREIPPLSKIELITEKNINCKRNTTGSYDLTVSWLTNFAADSNLRVVGTVVGSPAVTATKALYELNHSLTATGVAASGSYTITSHSQQTPVRTATAANVYYDCQAITTKLEIKDLVVTPQSNVAVASFITTGGAEQGKAVGQVIHLINTVTNVDAGAGGIVPEATPRNLHQFNLSSLTPNTKYQITVQANDNGTPNQVAVASASFVTLPLSAAKNTNVVLKVERDRVCDTWLYCRSAVTVKSALNQNQSLCFDVGLCNRLNPKTKDCEVAANLGQLGITSANQTFPSPNLVYGNTVVATEKEQAAVAAEKKFKNLSGYSKVGMDWGGIKVVEGYKHYALMNTMGENFNVPNGNFELSDVWPWKNNSLGEIGLMKDILHAGNNFLQVAVEKEQLAALTGTGDAYAGAMVPLGEIKATNDVVIAFNAGTAGETKAIRLAARTTEVGSGNVSYRNLYNTAFSIGGAGTSTVKKIDVRLPAGYTELIFNQLRSDNSAADSFSKAFYIDNVSAQSVLHVQNTVSTNAEGSYVARMCRLYPSSSAPACQYTDWSGGKLYNGWQGFCVEPDPGKPSQCLNWWPVDIIPGESDVFGNDPQVGYKDRKPLYYCLEAAGNYPFVRHRNPGTISDGIKDSELGTGRPAAWNLMYKNWDDQCDSSNPSDIAHCGWTGGSGRITTIATVEEANLRLVDIERIVLTPLCEEGGKDRHCFSKKDNDNAYLVLDRKNNWSASLSLGGKSNLDDWNKIRSILGNCTSTSSDFFGVHAVFEAGKYGGLQAGLCNHGGYVGFVRYGVTYYLREPCNVIAQVIDPYGQGYAWSNKILANGWNDASNILNYNYNQDYAPYGAAVPPAKDTNFPDRWTDPLFVQPPAVSSSYMAPYQVRAGSPFAIDQKVQKYCTNSGKLDQPCSNSGDCSTNSQIGACAVVVGKSGINYEPTCIAGDSESLGKACTEDYDCGFGLSGQTGTCMGIKLSEGQKQKIAGDYKQGTERLSNLFARGLNVWYWYADDNKYSQICSYNSGVDCGSPSDRNYATCVALRDACWDARATKGTAPGIDHLTVNNQTRGRVVGTGNIGVTIKFNSNVNINQLPLTGISVDWGDGKINDIVNLRIAPHVYNSNPTLNDPHIMTHTYTCQEGGVGWSARDGSCLFEPRVQIKDNWGWCNNGVRGTNSSICPASWQNSGVEVMVFPR